VVTYTDIFKLAATNKKVAKFVETYPQLFEAIRTLLNQPRSSSIHASALLVTPDTLDGEDMECFDYTPIKKIDGQLVSEFDGYVLDECGLLKNDCLATKELSKIQQTLELCNANYGTNLTLEAIATSQLDEPKVYELLSEGHTQNVFQLSSRGMTKFITEMKPSCIADIIAANALFRPATLTNGSTDSYIACKNGYKAPVYLWGTYDALKDTYGLITYQEQVVFIARQVGGFSLGDGVKLVKFISKKKTEKIQSMRDKFMKGAKENGCPMTDAEAIWEQIEACGSYLFNKSHATAYAITSYVGAYLKALFPTAFYTVALQWADDDDIPAIMTEMERCSIAKVAAPDINYSRSRFYTDFSTDTIFWSLTGIKHVGLKAVEWIVAERDKNGPYTGITNFIERVFKYKLKMYQYWDDPDNEEEATKCPVNARHVLNMILSGCFDKVENAQSVVERYAIVIKAAEDLGFKVKESDFPDDLISKHYWWSQQQIRLSGIGAIDYRRIYDTNEIKDRLRGKASYLSLAEVAYDENDGRRAIVCATIADMKEKHFVSSRTGNEETFCSLVLQQNNDTCECTIWPEEYVKFKDLLSTAKDKVIIFSGVVKYSDYTHTNVLSFTKTTQIAIL
jgi:DNA polymerase-3 subunit alpha